MGSYGEYEHTLVSGGSGPHSAAFANGDPGFKAMRTANGRTYVEHETGERELYDLRADPRQVRSLHDEPERVVEVSALSARLETLEYCPGNGCAEERPTLRPHCSPYPPWRGHSHLEPSASYKKAQYRVRHP